MRYEIDIMHVRTHFDTVADDNPSCMQHDLSWSFLVISCWLSLSWAIPGPSWLKVAGLDLTWIDVVTCKSKSLPISL